MRQRRKEIGKTGVVILRARSFQEWGELGKKKSGGTGGGKKTAKEKN